jgi:membrane-bound lytic murein transglycosylase D
MSEAQFREVNRIPPRMLIKAGSTLLVPRSAKQQTDVSEHVADNGQVSFSPEVMLRKLSVLLRKSETVASLAKRYKVSAPHLAGWNKVSVSGSFKAQQSVVLYLPVKAKVSKASRTTKGAKAAKGGKSGRAGKAASHKKRTPR